MPCIVQVEAKLSTFTSDNTIREKITGSLHLTVIFDADILVIKQSDC